MATTASTRGIRASPVRGRCVDAAVLIPVVDHGDEATVILTKRAEKLTSHSGQVAFPGGRIDPTDVSPEAAALRETEEEIGLDAEPYRDHRSDAGLCVGQRLPHRAGARDRAAGLRALAINEHEVDAAFEVPLRFLMDPANHRAEQPRCSTSRIWVFYDMPYGGQRIWGVTAGIIRTLYERLYL